MELTINVKKIGVRRGTVGWLVQSLQEGNLRIEEGQCKDGGNHGLWLKGEGVSQCLALWNEFDLSPMDAGCSNARRYAPVDERWNNGNTSGLTPAAWQTLRTMAEAWCEECEAELAAEQTATIKAVRINQ